MMWSMASAVHPLRYLSAADVVASMPALPERLALAEQAMRALVADADMPAKIAVHGRLPGTFGHAMPALLRGPAADGSGDRMGMKWVTGSKANNERGLPAISAIVVLNDPVTTVPIAILDGGPITAHRTAAVSGVAIRAFAPAAPSGRPVRIGILGAGTQARAHLPVVGFLLPGAEVWLFDRHPERAAAAVDEARRTAGIGAAIAVEAARTAVEGADVVLTLASFTTPERRQSLTTDRLSPGALVVAVDYDTLVAADVARDAAVFLVDDRPQFLVNREAGSFTGYPDPGATLGEALIAGTPRPAEGRVVVCHLGVGLADVIFGSAILDTAVAAGRGTILDR